MDRRDYGSRGGHRGGYQPYNSRSYQSGPPAMIPPNYPPIGSQAPYNPQVGSYQQPYGHGKPGSNLSAQNPSTVSVWIGKIGSGILDRSIRSILDIIGNLTSWKRTVDPKTNTLRSFGFAEFASAREAYLTRKHLNDLQLGDSRILVKIDEKNQKIVDEYLSDKSEEVKLDENQIKQIALLADDLNLTLGVDPIEPSKESQEKEKLNGQKPHSTLNGENVEKNEPKIETSKTEHAVDSTYRREEEKRRDIERKLELIEEDREREQRRLEKDEKTYRRLERDFEAAQRDRVHDLERRKKIDEERRIQRIEDMEKDTQDTEAWRAIICSSERRRIRQREKEQDQYDYEDEQAQLRAEMRRAEERHKEKVRLQQEEEAKRRREEAAARENEKKRQMDRVQMDKVQMDRVQMDKVQMDTENNLYPNKLPKSSASVAPSNQSSNAQSLLAKIPSDITSLFMFPVRWDLAGKHNLIEAKIKPWVTKKIVEYTGEEDKTLITFVCKHLEDKKPAQSLISELQPILEEESEVFVIKLWRLVVHESLKLEAEFI